MDFKTETKHNYTILTPVYGKIDASLTENIRQKWKNEIENGRKHIILDLRHCTEADIGAMELLPVLHEDFYTQLQSLVFTHIHSDLLRQMEEAGIEDRINIAPTMIEAVDIISMEILERDILGDE